MADLRQDVANALESVDLILRERDRLRATCEQQNQELIALRSERDMLASELQMTQTARDIYLEQATEASARLEAFGRQLEGIGQQVAAAIVDNDNRPYRQRLAAKAHQRFDNSSPEEDERLKNLAQRLAPALSEPGR